MRLLESALAELRARGWTPVLLISSNTGEVRSQYVSQFAAVLRLGDHVSEKPLLALIRRRLGRRSLRRQIQSWADDSGLGGHADFIADAISRMYYLSTSQMIRAFERVLDGLRPSGILTVSETGAAEAVVPVARRAGIPTVNVQHGIITDSPMMSAFSFDAFCVFGPEYGRILVESGTPESSIRVVGNPLLRTEEPLGVASKPGLDQEEGDGPCGSGTTHVSILFAAQHSRHHISDVALYATLSPLLEYAERHPECEVILKWHPLGEGAELGYRLALEDHPHARVVETRDADLVGLMKESCCVVVYSSTVGLDALSIRKPVIVIDPFRTRSEPLWIARYSDLVASNATELAVCIDRVRAGYEMSEDSWLRIQKGLAFAHDGLAGQRIADVCEELAATRARS